MCKRIELHAHSDVSNIRLLDAISTVEDLILGAADMNLGGIAFTEHESCSSHVKAILKVRELKEIDEETGLSRIPQDFKLILGNEIYLVDSLEEVRDNYESGVTKFPHFIILAKNKDGHEAIRTQSSQAWMQGFFTGQMERVPTTKAQLTEIVKKYPNTLIASSACLGSESSIHILNGDYDKAKSFLKWCSELFGEGNFYLELQPSVDEEQRHVNEKLIEFSSELGLELIITNDVHYLRPEDAEIHGAFLNSKGGDREHEKFYSNTYLHENQEIYNKLNYIDESIITKALENTGKIGDMIEEYTIEAPTVIPKIPLPEFELKHLFKQGYLQYPYISKMAYSKEEQDRYYLYLLEKGFVEYLYGNVTSKEYFHKILARLDIELEQLWEISEELNQPMTSYYVTIAKIVDLMWGDDCGDDSRKEGSLVGSGRGSAVAFLSNYILGITQVNPLLYGIEIPYWRHLHKSRSDIGALDIDLDLNSSKRHYVYDRMKEYFTEDKFLQVCTFGTEKSKSAIKTACRGLGYDSDAATYIASIVPFERGELWSIKDCLEGNIKEGRKAIPQFKTEIEKFPKLKETALKIEGLINKRSVHAGGILILNDHYTKTNALMKSPNGTYTTQFNLDDSQKMGNIKYDVLAIEANDKIQATMELLLDHGLIEWQGTLRKTFNKYFHPEVIDKENPELFELMSKGEVADLFQFSTSLGNSTVTKVKPANLIEMTATNSLMRLQSDGAEQPIDTFVRYKSDISQWYEEMREYGLNEKEISLFEKYLLPLNGVADTQESVMLMAMDKETAGFDVANSTVLRKSIAKKSKKEAEKAKDLLFKMGTELGTREVVLRYLWDVQISRMLSYAFSLPHTLAYSLIAMIQLNLNLYYNPIYWNTACLTVNSGSQEVEEDEKAKDTDYGKIASAIGRMQSYGVKVSLPSINKANFSFTPDIEENQIIFSLKGIMGIGDDVVHTIIEHRPYQSFEDFHERLYKGGLVTKGQILQLIKAGSFNEFDSPIEVMKQFLVKEVDVRDKLDGKNLPRIISLGLLDSDELIRYKHLHNFKSHISKSVHETIPKPKDRIFILDAFSQTFFFNNFTEKPIVGWHNNQPLVSEKLFKKEYDERMEHITNLYTDVEFIRSFNRAQFYELWKTHAEGSVSRWEMDSVSYYFNEHELTNVDYARYGLSDFFDLSETPIVVEEYEWRGRPMKNYQLDTIIGTVLDRNKEKHTVSILTPSGVVTAKLYSGSFGQYNKTISAPIQGTTKKKIIEKTWFTRGNLLMMTGFRREDQFVLKAPKGQHTINLITEVRSDGTLGLQSERARV